jgi:hypothetical protein
VGTALLSQGLVTQGPWVSGREGWGWEDLCPHKDRQARPGSSQSTRAIWSLWQEVDFPRGWVDCPIKSVWPEHEWMCAGGGQQGSGHFGPHLGRCKAVPDLGLICPHM